MKLSIIIPVYQVEATLDRCVRSVLSQDVNDMEVILVDDGSIDSSPQICNRWAHSDPCIRVIHKRNGGLSDARNAGIEAARGEYITFVDSDDELSEEKFYGDIVKMMDGDPTADIVEFNIIMHYGSDDEVPTDFYGSYESASKYWLESKAYEHAYAWNKIYRSSLFKETGIRFPKGKIFEDAYTLPLLLKHTRKISTYPTGYYHYYDNPNGITARADGLGLYVLLKAHLPVFEELSKDIKDKNDGLYPLLMRYYYSLLNIQLDVYRDTGKIILPSLHVSRISDIGVGAVGRMKLHLLNLSGIERLCKIHKTIKGR